ncbi:SCAPER domain-containing protein short spindle 3 isoform X2 [Haematobia irritans]|uniref:SCAPER domain-containing protein short spindle 3 isoform X2 n=1 Tax=Haematobia irritans TaxID=7368 RepID=UPI003F50B54F
MEVKEVLDREGRDAKNLVAYQISDKAVNLSSNYDKNLPHRKPPKSPNALLPFSLQTPKKSHSPSRAVSKQSTGPRVRSASTGRDKKSELQARYWALLFGNLQRAVNEIYQTVECYENISSCQEAILVLENYVRDFKALGEWFKVSWDYESRPLQQRPNSLAWEIRKSNPVPRVRAKSLSSPTVSGKSSPCPYPYNSGKSSPCLDGLSPRKGVRVNVRELFASSKRLINETPKDFDEQQQSTPPPPPPPVEPEEASPMILENRSHQYAQTDLEDDHLTLAGIREKMQREQEERDAEEERIRQQKLQEEEKRHAEEENKKRQQDEAELKQKEDSQVLEKEPTAVEMTIRKLECMENEFLASNTSKDPTPPETLLKKIGDTPVDDKTSKTGDPAARKPAAFQTPAVQSSPLKYSSVLNRPAVPSNSSSVNSQPPVKSISNTKSSTLRAANVGKAIPSKTPANQALKRTSTMPGSGSTLNSKPGYVATKTTSKNNRVTMAPRPNNNGGKPDVYGPPNNVASRLSARSRTMIEMNNNSNGTNNGPQKPVSNLLKRNTTNLSKSSLVGSQLSHRASKDDIGSSTSTLKASNEKISSSRNSINNHHNTHPTGVEDRRSEPKQLPSNNDSNDGWLTVKNRRRSSMHWSSRFNQPTGYASLPTLALLDEKQSDDEVIDNVSTNNPLQETGKTKQSPPNGVGKIAKATKNDKVAEKNGKSTQHSIRPEIKNAKAKVNSLPSQKKNVSQVTKETPPLSAKNGPVVNIPTRQTIIKRQKSDLTGLKMTSLHKEYMRSEKLALRKQNNITIGTTKSSEILNHHHLGSGDGSDINSSAETIVEAQNSLSPTDMLSSEMSSSGGGGDKIDIKIQTNRDFSKTIGDLYKSISNRVDISLTNSQVSNGPGTLSSCDENDECDEHQRLLVEEQESLERQIRELESTEIDVDTETDETDCEVGMLGNDRDEEEDRDDFNLDTSVVFVPINELEDDPSLSLETRYQALLSEMSWGEREEALATLQAYVSRHPGRAQELHQKLSSPSRRRSLQETLKKYQAKQARAQQKRELLNKEKAIKIQQLLARVEDVKAAKRQLIEDKRVKMEGRLQRAAENREHYLRQIIEKAHDEEKKLKEINFIKNIEAQNKRLDLIESSKETEGRLQDLEQERQKRLEEKAAKEAAVERRRQELEQARQRKLEKMNESRLEREQRIGKMQEQKEKQRQALAREKARDREERLLALQVHQQQTTEELQRKILQKQKESARRHEENIEHIRQRALELTIPSRNVEENGIVRSDIDEKVEDGDLSSTVSDVGSREHTRGYKKKMKKLKQRMSQAAEEYLKELQPVPLHMKRESQVPKYLNLVNKGGGSQGLERALGHLLRIMAKAQVFDFQCFLLLDGLGIITSQVITPGMQQDSEVTKKAVVIAVQLYRNACTLCPQIARHALLGNSIVGLFDALFQSLQLPEEKSPHHPVELSTELMLACTVALSPSYTKKHTHPNVLERLPDLISFRGGPPPRPNIEK